MRPLVAGLLAVVALATAGCDTGVGQPLTPEAETGTSPELVKEATEYGGWVLPANEKVLLVERSNRRDIKYRLAVEMSPTDLTWTLEQSRFGATLEKVYGPSYLETIAGPDLESSPNVQMARDRFVTEAGNTMYRKVIVDERDAVTRIVHLQFYNV